MSAASPTTAAPASATPLVEVNGIEVIYNHVILVLKGVSLKVPHHSIVALLGGNGAGKTTTLRAISGLVKPTRGNVRFAGKSLLGVAPHRIVARGLSHAPEGRGIFANLSVEENLDIGAYLRTDKAGVQRYLSFDYDRVADGNGLEQNVLLEPGDVVLVP